MGMRRCRLVWMVAFPGSELLDIAGPWEVLSHANDVLGASVYRLMLVSPRGGELVTRHGLPIGTSHSLRSAKAQGTPAIGLIAGGAPTRPLPPAEARFVDWLRRYGQGVPHWVSICTGAFVLGEAGLLDGRRATTHWRWSRELQRRFPKALVVEDVLFERAGSIWTSAGITAGIDLTLALVEQHHGRSVASAVARNLLLYLRRSGGQAQFSEALRRQGLESSALDGFTELVQEHLREALPVERIARGLRVSPRTLSRLCREQLGDSPAALVRKLRLEHARRLLEDTSLPLKAVADQCGLGDPSTLHRLFWRALRVSPAEYRLRFGSGSAR
jgi:transcriptional regulator GlxA family with amidase domain